ncbi:diguanylate cyclase domain-containing protein [Methylorubrum suomiense]
MARRRDPPRPAPRRPKPAGSAPCTVSLGIATREPGDPDLARAIERADAKLYQAKAQGRDRAA